LRQIAKQLELEQEAKYARLIAGRVVYVSEAEALGEEVLTTTDDRRGERSQLVSRANSLLKHIGFVHQMMRDDDPSQYQAVYDTLWNQYRDTIKSLTELDPEAADQFRDKVAARVKELEARINDLCDNWDPAYFDYFERTLACYEKNRNLLVALESIPPGSPQGVARRTRELLATGGWCLWKCRVLNGGTIVVVRDESVTGYPEYPVYTEAELKELCQDSASEATIRLVHEAKKLAGAVVTSVEGGV